MAVTSNRRTQLAVGVGTQVTLYRPNQQYERRAQHIERAVAGPPASANNVWRMAPDAITLRPVTHDISRLLFTAYAPNLIDSTQVTGAGMLQPVNTYTKVTGGGALSATITSGAPGFQKQVPSGSASDWTSELTADATAKPKPPDNPMTPDGADPAAIYTNIYPMDRVLVSKSSYPANQAFGVRLVSSGGQWPHDNFLTFYFGGQCSVNPAGASAGEFAVQFAGNGVAALWEFNAAAAAKWLIRGYFKWGGLGVPWENGHQVNIYPYGRNRIAFNIYGMEDFPGLDFQFWGKSVHIDPFTIAGPSSGMHRDYVQTSLETGFAKTQSMTGAGPIRVDIRRDNQDVFRINTHTYPATGLLIDGPITLQAQCPQDTPATVQIDGWLAPGTSITPQLYDADTGVALLAGIGGTFLLNASTRRIYATFTLATTQPSQTPVLFGYQVLIPGVYQTFTATPNTDAVIQAVRVDSSGFMPDQDLAVLRLQDLDGSLDSLLWQRDGVRCNLNIIDPSTGTLVSRLFEGETERPAGDQRGTPEDAGSFPDAGWREYPGLRLTSLWGRIARNPVNYRTNYAQDPSGAVDANGGPLPWRVTDIIKDVFNRAGVPADELDIPDLPMRLFLAPEAPFTYQLQFGSDPTRFLEFLVRDYLGASLIRDANAGARGIFRLIFPPADYANILAKFHILPPGYLPGKSQVDDSAYPTGESFVLYRNFREWTVRPETSSVTVVGIRDGKLLPVTLTNPLAAGDESILGYYAPYVRPPDPALASWEAVRIVARNIYQRACFKRQWCAFRAPLLLVTDPHDTAQVRPRPLRIDDVIQVGVRTALVRSVSINYTTSDELQFADYQAMYVT